MDLSVVEQNGADGAGRNVSNEVHDSRRKEKDAQTDSAFSDLCQRYGTLRLALRIGTSRPILGGRQDVYRMPR